MRLHGASSPIRRAVESNRSRSSADGETIHVGASLVVVSCGAVNSAALLLRSAQRRTPERPGELIGARRPALHGAPRHDDAGVSSVPEKRHRLSEDRRDQRLLPPRTGHDLSARPDSVAGSYPWRHGADRGALDSALGVRCLGGTRRRLARDVRGPAARGESRDCRPRRTDSAALPTEQPRRACPTGRGNEADPRSGSASGR